MAGTTNNLSPRRARGRSAGHHHHHHQSPPPTCSPSNRNAKNNVQSHSTVAATTTALPLHVMPGSSSYSTTSPSRTSANQYRNSSSSSSSSHSHMSPSSFNNASHVYGNRLSHVNAAQRSALPLHSSGTNEGMGGDTGYRYPTYSTTSTSSMNPILGDYSSRPQLEFVQRNIQLAAARALEEHRRHISSGNTTSASNQRFISSSFSNRHSTSTTSQRSPTRGTTFNQTSRDVLRLSAMAPAVNVTRLPPGAIAVRAQQQSAPNPLSGSSFSNANATSTSSNPFVHSQQRQMMQSFFFTSNAAAAATTFQQQFTSKKVVNVKKEKALQKVEEESKPKTAQEADILSQLRGMGFHDPPTILSAIRTVVSKSESSHGEDDDEVMIVPTTQQLVDQTMVFLLSQKEELEEAALLDRARVSSERDKDQTARQALTKEQDLMNCKSEEGQSLSSLMSYFNKSELLCHDGVLNFIRQIWSFPSSSSVTGGGGNGTKSKASTTATIKRCNDVKRHIVEVLLLEQKALKWYGNSQLYGAKSFFRHALAPGIVKEAKVLVRHDEETPKKSKAKSSHCKEGTAKATKKKRQPSNPTPKRSRGKSSETTRTPRKKRSSQSPPSQDDDTGDRSHCQSGSIPDVDAADEGKVMSSETQQPVEHHPSSTRNELTLTPKVVTTFLTYLKGQIDTIKRGLYSLEEQEGNMPKIFVKANRDAKEFGWWSSVTDGEPSGSSLDSKVTASTAESDGHDSDDIEIIEVEAPPSCTKKGSKGGGGSSSPSKKVEVIELLD